MLIEAISMWLALNEDITLINEKHIYVMIAKHVVRIAFTWSDVST